MSDSKENTPPGHSFAGIVASQVMHRDPITVGPDQSLTEVRRLLLESRIGGVPVVEHGKLCGTISRSDLARVQDLVDELDAQINDQRDWEDQQADGFQHAGHPTYEGFRQRLAALRVRDAMRAQVITCSPTTPVDEVAAEMLQNHIHRVIVVEGERPVGIITSLDLLRVASGRAKRS